MSAPDVAVVGPYPAIGELHGGHSGVASYDANLAHALAGEGATVCVIAPTAEGQPSRGHDGPVQVRRAFDPGRPAGLITALAAARATGAPVVHLQHEHFLYGGAASIPGVVAGLAAMRRAGTPTLLTMHQVVDRAHVTADYARMHRIAVPSPLARVAVDGLQRLLPRLASSVVVHERTFAKHVTGARTIPHGVEVHDPPTQPERASARRQAGLPATGLVVLCFGFLAPYKGLELALDAARLAGDVAHLVVAGGAHPRLEAAGDDYATVLRDANPHARFTDRVPDEDVATWFRAADLALFAYPRPHASSGALALALAHGTPALLSAPLARAADAPGIMVAPDSARALARTLEQFASDRGRLSLLRSATEAMALERRWPAVARQHLDLYATLTGSPRRSVEHATADLS